MADTEGMTSGLWMRSKLFVPGSQPALFAKALASAADALSIDLEDAVPEAAKATARDTVATWLRQHAAAADRLIVVRVNAIDSPHFEADLLAVAQPGVALVNLPKPNSAGDVHRAALALERAEKVNGVTTPIGLLVNVETPKALRMAAALAFAHPRVAGLQLGLGDLFEPLGIDRRDLANVHAAMTTLRMAAGEAGVAAIDGAFGDVSDPAGYRAEAQMARRLGFVGKTCIHPSQVPLANEVFSVSGEELEKARRVVQAAAAARAEGRGAVLVDGRMIDAPFVARAQAIVDAAQAGTAA